MTRVAEPDADVVKVEIDGGVAVLTLNRPDRLNAYTPAMEARYFDLLEQMADHRDVRVIVVTGAGRGFCAGVDVEALQDATSGGEWGSENTGRDQTAPLLLPKPVIAAVNGACAGMGLVIALMCDVRFAAAGAKLTTAFSRRGLVAEQGIAWVLPRIVGPSRALDLLLSSRVIRAEEALQIGVVDRVVEPDSVLTEAVSYARDLAEHCSPRSMQAIKRQVWSYLDMDLASALGDTTQRMRRSLEYPDFAEGVASFAEKRAPMFPPLEPNAKDGA